MRFAVFVLLIALGCKDDDVTGPRGVQSNPEPVGKTDVDHTSTWSTSDYPPGKGPLRDTRTGIATPRAPKATTGIAPRGTGTTGTGSVMGQGSRAAGSTGRTGVPPDAGAQQTARRPPRR